MLAPLPFKNRHNASPELVIPPYTYYALDLFRALPHASVAILPSGRGDYIGRICSPDKKSKMPALVTAMIGPGYGPRITR